VNERKLLRQALRSPRGLRTLRRYIDGLTPSALYSLRRLYGSVPATTLESSPFRTAIKEILNGNSD
jgi:hypothetical protein